MTVSRACICLMMVFLLGGAPLWAQTAPSVDAAAGEAAKAVAAADPLAAEVAGLDGEEALFDRDPFLTWIPALVESSGGESFGRGPRGEIVEEIPFDPTVYTVTGIVWGVEKARAIINGKIFGVGDKVVDADILKIDKEGILLLFHEQEYLLARSVIDQKNSGEGAI